MRSWLCTTRYMSYSHSPSLLAHSSACCSSTQDRPLLGRNGSGGNCRGSQGSLSLTELRSSPAKGCIARQQSCRGRRHQLTRSPTHTTPLLGTQQIISGPLRPLKRLHFPSSLTIGQVGWGEWETELISICEATSSSSPVFSFSFPCSESFMQV